MTDTTADRELGLQEEDRLPWLEAVETDDEEESFSPTKTIGFVVAALLALGLIVGGVMWLRGQREAPSGDGTLIAAQQGDYKVRPDEPGGMKVEGQGDSAFATSEGKEANGQIDQGALPETPMTAQKGAAPAKPAIGAAKPVVTAVVPESSRLAPPNAAKMPNAPMPTSSGGVVQLGAFGSAAVAEAAWTRLTAANPSLAKLQKSVMQANVGGSTVYRLRANAGSPAAAAAVCKQVSNCMVVR